MERKSSLTASIKGKCGLGRRGTVGVQSWEKFRPLRAEAFVASKEEALRTASEWQDLSDTV